MFYNKEKGIGDYVFLFLPFIPLVFIFLFLRTNPIEFLIRFKMKIDWTPNLPIHLLIANLNQNKPELILGFEHPTLASRDGKIWIRIDILISKSTYGSKKKIKIWIK